MADTTDGFALQADGAAADPQAYQAALRGDPEKLASIQTDPDIAKVVLGDDVDALQKLLRSVYAAEVQRLQSAAERRNTAERTIDAQRADATVPRDTVQLYEQLKAAGLQYGPAFRLLRNVHVPDTSVQS